ncbi:MAG: DUF4878 domain-containing protein [Cardiobacteriaceae bacterium]|nr:DUF4878 domain-containing protein [Cardiobacteriaceae bacterium]
MKKFWQGWLLAVMAALLVACGGDAPDEVAKSFYRELLEGDGNKAVALVYWPEEVPTEAQTQAKGKITMMAGAFQENAKEEGGVADIKAGEVRYTNADKSEATVEVTIEMKSGKTETDRVPVIKTDKGWKVNIK